MANIPRTKEEAIVSTWPEMKPFNANLFLISKALWK
jgi:hypothetical protein